MRMIAGKCMMDRNVPEALRDTPQSGYGQSKALIERWHGKGRLLYAITPRWAGSSTQAQLEAAGALWREHPELHVQTHIAENRDEVSFIAKLFPERKDFLDVYEYYGLVGRRSVLGHAVWFSDSEFCRCHERDASIAHCPTSNLFLGSGLFQLRKAKDQRRPSHVGIGTDIGAGTSFSQLATLNEAYNVGALVGGPITAVEGLYLATLGGARARSRSQYRLAAHRPRGGHRRAGPKGYPAACLPQFAVALDRGNPVCADDPRRRPSRARDLCCWPIAA